MFAKILAQLRKDKNISQYKLAKDLNFAQSTIGMWESGKRQPDYATMIRISEYFNVSIDYILSGKENKLEIPEDFDYLITLYNGLPTHLKTRGLNLLEGLYLSVYKELPEIVFKINKI